MQQGGRTSESTARSDGTTQRVRESFQNGTRKKTKCIRNSAPSLQELQCTGKAQLIEDDGSEASGRRKEDRKTEVGGERHQ